MAKANRVFSGLNSYGIKVQVAEREDGKWFSRSKENTRNNFGYRAGWCAWHALDFTPKHPIRLRNAVETGGAPEYVELPAANQGEYLEWGFTILYKDTAPNRLRLPTA